MEFETFIPKTTHSSSRRAQVTINRNGMVSFSAAAIERLGLKPGDTINFERDKKTADWYVVKRNNGYLTVRTYKGAKSLCFNCASLVAEMMLGHKDTVKRLQIPLAAESVEAGHWCLIMSAAK